MSRLFSWTIGIFLVILPSPGFGQDSSEFIYEISVNELLDSHFRSNLKVELGTKRVPYILTGQEEDPREDPFITFPPESRIKITTGRIIFFLISTESGQVSLVDAKERWKELFLGRVIIPNLGGSDYRLKYTPSLDNLMEGRLDILPMTPRLQAHRKTIMEISTNTYAMAQSLAPLPYKVAIYSKWKKASQQWIVIYKTPPSGKREEFSRIHVSGASVPIHDAGLPTSTYSIQFDGRRFDMAVTRKVGQNYLFLRVGAQNSSRALIRVEKIGFENVLPDLPGLIKPSFLLLPLGSSIEPGQPARAKINVPERTAIIFRHE